MLNKKNEDYVNRIVNSYRVGLPIMFAILTIMAIIFVIIDRINH